MISNPDKKYFIEGGEQGFNPEQNKWVIEDSIRRYELMRKRKMKDFRDGISERAEAVASYLTSSKGAVYKGFSESGLTKYFGKRKLADLQGKNIIERLSSKLSTVKGKSQAPNIILPDGSIKGRSVNGRKKA